MRRKKNGTSSTSPRSVPVTLGGSSALRHIQDISAAGGKRTLIESREHIEKPREHEPLGTNHRRPRHGRRDPRPLHRRSPEIDPSGAIAKELWLDKETSFHRWRGWSTTWAR